jgi:hypothetical protein
LSFALKRIEPLIAIIIIVFYLLVLYLLALSNTPENPFASIYSESLIKTACQHLLLLVGFDTLIYRKYYNTPPILVGHHSAAPTDNVNLGKFMTAVLGTCTRASTRQDIACQMGARKLSIVGSAMNYGELRVGTAKWGSETGEEDA